MRLLRAGVSLFLIVVLSGCATTVRSVRENYDNPGASDAALMKDHADCAKEGDDAANGWLIAGWATMPLAFTIIGAVIPIGRLPPGSKRPVLATAAWHSAATCAVENFPISQSRARARPGGRWPDEDPDVAMPRDVAKVRARTAMPTSRTDAPSPARRH